ncbi:hypothetical protein QMN58_24240, partial [Escherichia coli]|nr:hypothetical protein [Escherichia coli]
ALSASRCARHQADAAPSAASVSRRSASGPSEDAGKRDADSADVRVRIAHIARTLIALAALLFCMLITALGMYAKRNRLLAGRSNEFEWAALHDAMPG